ncbi:hypothetical protein ABK040_009219 [Willaertia magna]
MHKFLNRNLKLSEIGKFFGPTCGLLYQTLSKVEGAFQDKLLAKPYPISIYFDVSGQENFTDLAVGFFLKEKLNDNLQQKIKEILGEEHEFINYTIPSTNYGHYRYIGPYKHLGDIWGQFCQNIESVSNNQFKAIWKEKDGGISWEEYPNDPRQEQDENKLITELYTALTTTQ